MPLPSPLSALSQHTAPFPFHRDTTKPHIRDAKKKNTAGRSDRGWTVDTTVGNVGDDVGTVGGDTDKLSPPQWRI